MKNVKTKQVRDHFLDETHAHEIKAENTSEKCSEKRGEKKVGKTYVFFNRTKHDTTHTYFVHVFFIGKTTRYTTHICFSFFSPRFSLSFSLRSSLRFFTAIFHFFTTLFTLVFTLSLVLPESFFHWEFIVGGTRPDICAATFRGSNDIIDRDARWTLKRVSCGLGKAFKRDDRIGHGRRSPRGRIATTSSHTPLRRYGCQLNTESVQPRPLPGDFDVAQFVQ